jgi:hypothetical protein
LVEFEPEYSARVDLSRIVEPLGFEEQVGRFGQEVVIVDSCLVVFQVNLKLNPGHYFEGAMCKREKGEKRKKKEEQ